MRSDQPQTGSGPCSELDRAPPHRAALGIRPERPWLDTLHARYRLPAGSTGHIDPHDAAFLWDLVESTQAETVVEIGTAAGVSALLLAAALDGGVRRSTRTPSVETYDLHPWCYFDRTKPIGFAIRELDPSRADQIRVHTRATARDAGTSHTDLPLVFIDADHRHPAPTLDVLALLPALRPGAWVALHDIRLPELAERERRRTGHQPEWAAQTGPSRLYNQWPFETLEPIPAEGAQGTVVNTGAIRIPDEPQRAAGALREIARRGTREVEPHASVADLRHA